MIEEIANQIKARMGNFKPQTAIILGSGLGNLGDIIEDKIVIKYQDIKGFPQVNIQGHKAQLIIGRLEGKDVLCMQGRIHLYEGHAPSTINMIIKAFSLLGIKNLIVTNAAGSLRKELAPGSIMLIKDHINFSGFNSLIGPNDEKFGPRFPDMSDAYNSQIREKVKKIAVTQNIKLDEGVYFMVSGPNFETTAEIKAFQTLGADCVGMSTVPEVICAVHSGMKVLGFSVITNFGTGLRTGTQSHEETLREGEKAALNLTQLVRSYIKEA